MMKIRERLNQEGLTLIELLVTIAVLAIVAAIAIPVVTNVVNSTNDRAIAQTQSDIADFVEKYNESGAYSYDSTEGKFVGYIDLNGNGSVDAGETIDELDIDTAKFSISASATDAPADAASVDFGVTPTAVFTVEAAASATAAAAWTVPSGYTANSNALGNFQDGVGAIGASPTWTADTPVLVVLYGDYVTTGWAYYYFTSTLAAEYTIDYYDASGYGTTADGLSYQIDTSGVYPSRYAEITQYDNDPLLGPANKVAINWAGAAGGGGK